MAGYSGKKLWQKLGMNSDQVHVVLNMPEDYIELLEFNTENFSIQTELKFESNFIHFFTKSRIELESTFPQLIHALAERGMIWISWPKKSAKVVTDLDENIVREIGLALGVVDVKVCAVSEIWSGLKFVYRVK